MTDVAEPPAKQARLGEPPPAPTSANIIVQFRAAAGELSGKPCRLTACMHPPAYKACMCTQVYGMSMAELGTSSLHHACAAAARRRLSARM